MDARNWIRLIVTGTVLLGIPGCGETPQRPARPVTLRAVAPEANAVDPAQAEEGGRGAASENKDNEVALDELVTGDALESGSPPAKPSSGPQGLISQWAADRNRSTEEVPEEASEEAEPEGEALAGNPPGVVSPGDDTAVPALDVRALRPEEEDSSTRAGDSAGTTDTEAEESLTADSQPPADPRVGDEAAEEGKLEPKEPVEAPQPPPHDTESGEKSRDPVDDADLEDLLEALEDADS